MANFKIGLDVETWIRDCWLLERYSQPFRACSVLLNTGGKFDFDAVSTDDQIIANISTSNLKTAGGKNGIGKIHKLRADMLFLTMANAATRLIVLTEKDMAEFWWTEKERGRVPIGIEIVHAEIPASLRAQLEKAKEIASLEVTPKKSTNS